MLLTNLYKLYLSVCDEVDASPAYNKQQDEFRDTIAEFWYNPEKVSSKTATSCGKKRSITEMFDSSNHSCFLSIVTSSSSSPVETKSAKMRGKGC